MRGIGTSGRRLGVAVRSSPAGPALAAARRLTRQLLLARPARSLVSPLLASHRGRATCLLYHRVHTGGDPAPQWGNAGLSVAQDDFDRQMSWVARHCRCFALDEAISRLADGRLPPDSALVTFDDGFRDNLEHALPVLEKHGVPATLFVATGLIDAGTDPWWIEIETLLGAIDELEIELAGRRRRWRLRSTGERSVAFDEIVEYARSATPHQLERLMTRLRAAGPTRPAVPANPMLTWDELGILARHPLITLGAHTVSHPSLRALAEEDAAREIEESKRVLERRCDVKVDHLAYPFGSRAQVGPREADLAARAGLRSAFTALEGHLHDGHARQPFLLPRFPITRRDGILGTRFKLSGWRALLENRGERLVTI